MKTETWKYEDVNSDGTIKGGGAVRVKGSTLISRNEGCGLGNCNCSPGFFISIGKDRTSTGIVEGVTYFFDDLNEMENYIQSHNIIASESIA